MLIIGVLTAIINSLKRCWNLFLDSWDDSYPTRFENVGRLEKKVFTSTSEVEIRGILVEVMENTGFTEADIEIAASGVMRQARYFSKKRGIELKDAVSQVLGEYNSIFDGMHYGLAVFVKAEKAGLTADDPLRTVRFLRELHDYFYACGGLKPPHVCEEYAYTSVLSFLEDVPSLVDEVKLPETGRAHSPAAIAVALSLVEHYVEESRSDFQLALRSVYWARARSIKLTDLQRFIGTFNFDQLPKLMVLLESGYLSAEILEVMLEAPRIFKDHSAEELVSRLREYQESSGDVTFTGIVYDDLARMHRF